MVFKFYFLTLLLSIKFILSESQDYSSKMVVGLKNNTISLNNEYEIYEIQTNYKHLQIKLEKIKNIDKILITDKPVASNNVKECASDANICQSMENIIKY